MPKMSRSTFMAAVDDIWGYTQQRLLTNGSVYATVVAFDAMARQKIFMQVPADDGRLAAAGAVTVSGPFPEHLDLLRTEFNAHRAVAALMYAEAWAVLDEAMVDTVRMGLAPHEHPMKDEIAFSYGVWPREFVSHGHVAVMRRGDRGEILGFGDTGRIHPENTLLMFSWLNDLLPQPR